VPFTPPGEDARKRPNSQRHLRLDIERGTSRDLPLDLEVKRNDGLENADVHTSVFYSDGPQGDSGLSSPRWRRLAASHLDEDALNCPEMGGQLRGFLRASFTTLKPADVLDTLRPMIVDIVDIVDRMLTGDSSSRSGKHEVTCPCMNWIATSVTTSNASSPRGFTFNYLAAALAAVSSNRGRLRAFFEKDAVRTGGKLTRLRRRKNAAGVAVPRVGATAALYPPQ
jgi:hypothetical protein